MILVKRPSCSVPDGKEEEDNIIVSEWGTKARKIGESFHWHDDIALSLRGLDLPAAVRMSGSRFSVLTGQVARLERGLINYFLDYFTGLKDDHKYEEVSVPLIVTRSTLESTGKNCLSPFLVCKSCIVLVSSMFLVDKACSYG